MTFSASHRIVGVGANSTRPGGGLESVRQHEEHMTDEHGTMFHAYTQRGVGVRMETVGLDCTIDAETCGGR